MEKEFRNDLNELYSIVSTNTNPEYIYLRWFGNHVTVEDLAKVAGYEFEVCEKLELTSIINDNSRLFGSWDHTLEWNVNYWLPKALALGINKLALIVSDDVFEQLSAAELQQSFDARIRTHIFKDLNTAEQWIIS